MRCWICAARVLLIFVLVSIHFDETDQYGTSNTKESNHATDLDKVYSSVLPDEIDMATLLPDEIPSTPSIDDIYESIEMFELWEAEQRDQRFRRNVIGNDDSGSGSTTDSPETSTADMVTTPTTDDIGSGTEPSTTQPTSIQTTAMDTTTDVLVQTTIMSTELTDSTETTEGSGTTPFETAPFTVETTPVPEVTTTTVIVNIVNTQFRTVNFVNATTPQFRQDMKDALETLYNNITTPPARRRKRATSPIYNITIEDAQNLDNNTINVDYSVATDNMTIPADEAVARLNVTASVYEEVVSTQLNTNVSSIVLAAVATPTVTTPSPTTSANSTADTTAVFTTQEGTTETGAATISPMSTTTADNATTTDTTADNNTTAPILSTPPAPTMGTTAPTPNTTFTPTTPFVTVTVPVTGDTTVNAQTATTSMNATDAITSAPNTSTPIPTTAVGTNPTIATTVAVTDSTTGNNTSNITTATPISTVASATSDTVGTTANTTDITSPVFTTPAPITSESSVTIPTITTPASVTNVTITDTTTDVNPTTPLLTTPMTTMVTIATTGDTLTTISSTTSSVNETTTGMVDTTVPFMTTPTVIATTGTDASTPLPTPTTSSVDTTTETTTAAITVAPETTSIASTTEVTTATESTAATTVPTTQDPLLVPFVNDITKQLIFDYDYNESTTTINVTEATREALIVLFTNETAVARRKRATNMFNVLFSTDSTFGSGSVRAKYIVGRDSVVLPSSESAQIIQGVTDTQVQQAIVRQGISAPVIRTASIQARNRAANTQEILTEFILTAPFTESDQTLISNLTEALSSLYPRNTTSSFISINVTDVDNTANQISANYTVDANGFDCSESLCHVLLIADVDNDQYISMLSTWFSIDQVITKASPVNQVPNGPFVGRDKNFTTTGIRMEYTSQPPLNDYSIVTSILSQEYTDLFGSATTVQIYDFDATFITYTVTLNSGRIARGALGAGTGWAARCFLHSRFADNSITINITQISTTEDRCRIALSADEFFYFDFRDTSAPSRNVTYSFLGGIDFSASIIETFNTNFASRPSVCFIATSYAPSIVTMQLFGTISDIDNFEPTLSSIPALGSVLTLSGNATRTLPCLYSPKEFCTVTSCPATATAPPVECPTIPTVTCPTTNTLTATTASNTTMTQTATTPTEASTNMTTTGQMVVGPACILVWIFWVVVGLLILFIIILVIVIIILCIRLRRLKGTQKDGPEGPTIPTETPRPTIPTGPPRATIPTEPIRTVIPPEPIRTVIPPEPIRTEILTEHPSRAETPRPHMPLKQPQNHSPEAKYDRHSIPQPDLPERLVPDTMMMASPNHEIPERVITTFHPSVGLPPIRPPLMSERMRLQAPPMTPELRDRSEIERHRNKQRSRKMASRPKHQLPPDVDPVTQKAYDEAQTSIDEVLVPRAPAVFYPLHRKRPHKRKGKLDMVHPQPDPDLEVLLGPSNQPPGNYTVVTPQQRATEGLPDTGSSNSSHRPDDTRQKMAKLLEDAFSLVSPRSPSNAVAPQHPPLTHVGSMDSGIFPSPPYDSNNFGSPDGIAMPQPHGRGSKAPKRRQFSSPTLSPDETSHSGDSPLFTRRQPPLVHDPQPGVRPLTYKAPASATPSGEAAYITPIRKTRGVGNSVIWTPYRAFDEVSRLESESDSLPNSAPSPQRPGQGLPTTPPLTNGTGDVRLPSTSLPGDAEMQQQIRDELARLSGQSTSAGSSMGS